MRYTFRQLEYFVAAAETGSITLASERIHISQPSISTAISHLERELGVQLFLRHHAQGLSLTPVGRLVLTEAKDLIERGSALYSLVSEANAQVRGQLNLGCFITLAPLVLPELSHSFSVAFPATQVRHVEHSQEPLLEGLRRADIDIALTYDLHLTDDVDFEPLARLPPHVWVSEADPLAQQSATTLEELAEKPLVLLDLPASREYFLGLFAARGLEPKIAARSAHQEVIRTMVANGHGYSLANVRPKSDLALDGRKVVRIRIAGEHRPMTMGLATLVSRRKSRLVEAFELHCRAFVSDSYIPGMAAPAIERRTKR